MSEKKANVERLTLEDMLGLVKFNVAAEAHLQIDKEKCRVCKERFCLHVCPVGNYTEDEADPGEIVLSWEGCMECGTCRLACPHDAIDWNYPVGAKGVCFRHG